VTLSLTPIKPECPQLEPQRPNSTTNAVRVAALKTLSKLEPATLEKHVDAAIALLDGSDAGT
jgi:hypothetical protein|tara:strand:- start:2116 stop:2301 length:186 start_codon:yes stop_codon:yes gene_type:complete